MKFEFITPCTASIVGSTGSGKTYATLNIVRYKNEIFDIPPKKVIWCYSEMQDVYTEFKDEIVFHKGMVNINDLGGQDGHTLIILDDLMSEIDEDLAKAFCVLSHHRNISIFFLSQSLFHKNPHARTISLNSHYIFLFRMKRDMSSIIRFASQLAPGNTNTFMDIYKRHTDVPFSYILINLHPKETGSVSLHAGILPYNIQHKYTL